MSEPAATFSLLPPTGAPRSTPVEVGGVRFGGRDFVVIAGPCAIESQASLLHVAGEVRASGAAMLRGGIYKLRTHPSSFRGLGVEAFAAVASARQRTGMPLVAEVTDPRQVEALVEVVDMLQVGARNMRNYELLHEVGAAPLPVLLKRAFSARLDEWLLAAEHVVRAGNERIVLCERGIRTFETALRNTLDLAGVAYLKQRCDFPVLVDPSHGTGDPSLMLPVCRAAAAVGADGLMVEVHPKPQEALSDGEQALDPAAFTALIDGLRPVLRALDRPLHPAPGVEV